MNNLDVRQALKAAKIPYWRIADVLGVHENTVMRMLRHELSEKDKAMFMQIISDLKAKK